MSDLIFSEELICPHCGQEASEKERDKFDFIDGEVRKVICENEKCNQQFIVQIERPINYIISEETL